MYDDLVKRLREPCQYENCVLCKEAADAIEKLGNEVKAHRMRYGWVDSEDGGQDDV